MPYLYPYPNEHSARLQNPNMPHIRVGRTNGSGDGTVQGVKVPATIAIIWYITKKGNKEVPIAQALRFPISKWTEQEARSWLKTNKIKYISFEPAAGKKNSNSAPAGACIFNETTIVGFTDTGTEEEKNKRFRIVAYSGQIIKNHWFWGNLAFDLKGIAFDKPKTPILEEHARNVRVGFSTMQQINDAVLVEGKFLTNDSAQKIRGDMVEGFPMQASVMNVPAIIERVEQGASVIVNGQKLDGPGTVFRKSTIYEVSLCCLGADNKTSSEVCNKLNDYEFQVLGKGPDMEETQTMTKELFAEQYPDILAEITASAKTEGKAEGEKAIRDQFAEFEKRFGKDPAFCIEQFKTLTTLEAAITAYTAKLAAENARLKEEAGKAAAAKAKQDPAVQAFSDDAASKANQGKEQANNPEGWEKEFAESEDLQKEFSNAKEYVAFKKAEAMGRVRILSHKE